MTTAAIKAQELDYFGKYYGDLVGAKVLSFDGMQDDDLGGDGFPTFTVLFKSGEKGKIQISCDPEGNRGGFIFGLAAPN
jgi:hypothetical protein